MTFHCRSVPLITAELSSEGMSPVRPIRDRIHWEGTLCSTKAQTFLAPPRFNRESIRVSRTDSNLSARYYFPLRVFLSPLLLLVSFLSLSLFPRIDEPLRTVKLENIAGKQSGPPAGKQRNKLFPVDAKFVTVKISETNKQKGKVPQRRKRNEMRFPIQSSANTKNRGAGIRRSKCGTPQRGNFAGGKREGGEEKLIKARNMKKTVSKCRSANRSFLLRRGKERRLEWKGTGRSGAFSPREIMRKFLEREGGEEGVGKEKLMKKERRKEGIERRGVKQLGAG